MTSIQDKESINLLLPGEADPKRLLALWYLRKSFFGILFAGLAVAFFFGYSENATINWTDPNEVVSDLFSPSAGIVLAFILRFLVNQLALLAAYPLVKNHENSTDSKIRNPLWRWLDRLHILRGLRSLRWSRHIRKQAAVRIGSQITESGRLDVIISISNILLFFTMIASIILLG